MHEATLKKMWEQCLQGQKADNATWAKQLQAIFACGKGLDETLQYLYIQRPSLKDFLTWMNVDGARTGRVDQAIADDVLTSEDMLFFKTNGYLVLRSAVSEDARDEARTVILEHLHASIDDPASWYDPQHDRKGLMVQLYHQPVLDRNRRSARIRKAFEQLYESTALHPVVEKVSFNPPETSSYKFMGSKLHWDVSLAQPIPFKLQGLIYLSDCGAEAGAFHCVPGFHNKIGEWINSLPADTKPREEALRTLSPIAVTGNAGDLVIWHQALPHCATPNHSNHPRFVQYITYDPDDYRAQEMWV